MKLKFDYNFMFEEYLGKDYGISIKEIEQNINNYANAFNNVTNNLNCGMQEWTDLPNNQNDLIKEINSTKKLLNYDTVVVLGIGGSALGTIAVSNALLNAFNNENQTPKLYVMDNIDPDEMFDLLNTINLKTTVFNVITKSGETSETLSQFLIIYEKLKKVLGKNANKQILITTTKGKGTLYNIAKQEGFKIFDIPKGVGGRFSVLSAVGLVPFMLLNFDVEALLNGAKNMKKACVNPNYLKNPALFSAILHTYYFLKGKNISVLMPYSSKLKYFADFYCQIWAESLGKNVDKNLLPVICGQTPVKSLGVTDQHSQVQLYVEGPDDKIITFLKVEKFNNELSIPNSKFENLDFLNNKTLNELIISEQAATEFALTKAHKPNYNIILPNICEETIGELIMYFEFCTAFAGAILNIDTYNQPGVEEGKLATFALMGKRGYENKLNEIKSIKKNKKFIID